MERMAEPGTTERTAQIRGALARGYCHPNNADKVLDSDLIEAMAAELLTLLRTDECPRLGCATTRQLIDEVIARTDIDLNYRTIDAD